MGISGGIDSSYLLVWAVKMGLRPLVVHFDNGYNTPEAEANMARIVKELNVTVTVHEELVSFDPPVMQVTAKVSDGKDSIESKAVVGVDLEQKGMQMPQKYGAASSYGKKYALGNLFLIDDTQDSDATNTHGKSSAKQKMTNESLAKAKEYIAKGGSLSAIKAKYEVTPKQAELLTTL